MSSVASEPMQGTGHIAHSGEEILKHGRQIKQMLKHGQHHSLGQSLTAEVAIAITTGSASPRGRGNLQETKQTVCWFLRSPRSHGAFFNDYRANGHGAFINGYGANGHEALLFSMAIEPTAMERRQWSGAFSSFFNENGAELSFCNGDC
ncbi:hypothetical protein SUGI_0632440 [Cryptomeria japonica]|nr:hypothetical protein SUGI_0632440 [Cryptomeria japonica]